MPPTLAVRTMIGLDILMIVYTLWALGLAGASRPFRKAVGLGLGAWLVILHLGLSNQALFPATVRPWSFLAIIFVAVGLVGALLFSIAPLRRFLLSMPQQHLMLLQGVRVFFGATFLMQASLGDLPKAFGIIDGYTHIGAGFFGLIAAYSLSSGAHGIRRAWFANLFGLVDILLVASTLALILLPEIGPHHSMMYAVFLPAPLWLWLHVISIWRLRSESCGSEMQQASVEVQA